MKSLEERKKDRAERMKESIDENDPENVNAHKEAVVAQLNSQAKEAAKQPAEVKKAAETAQWQPNQQPSVAVKDKDAK